MENIDKTIKEATSNITIDNKPLDKEELKVIRDALESKQQSFIKTLYDKVIGNDKKNRRK